jgi:hypothetical protein
MGERLMNFDDGHSDSADTVEKVRKLLGAPVLMDFTENVRKIRAQLIVFSSIAIAVVWMGVSIKPETPVFGIPFNGLTANKILFGLVLVVAYQLVHFAWAAWDSFNEWRVRRTGSRAITPEPGLPRIHEIDYPADPRQSTLYNWWLNYSAGMVNAEKKLDEIHDEFKEMHDEYIKLTVEEKMAWSQSVTMPRDSTALLHELGLIQRSIQTAQKLVMSKRLEVSLERFDQTFKHFVKSQNLRWILLELSLPLVLGLFALGSLAYGLWKST